ncbi:peptidylprolyl isomerase [Palleronia sp. LCG004]|uniref:peptidylprolyl isomerase n=1 Tax=Palleronia sp. LCG004 TaxID=3079304 RepID=UPI0029430165|nr:peptidylprolyl isomerase [Palleronia sp. LCG004]WOI54994.1 peptidylprolyl isomerase [Palleronia sp. LCG004]
MHKLALALALFAAPAYATGLEIDLGGGVDGVVTIDLFEDVAPNHVGRITELARRGAYDGVVFHRVIDGFMAQTGDVQFGRADGDLSRAGYGGSDLPDLEQEFSDVPFERGVVGMARSGNSVDSANSQFFIMFDPAPHLNGDYTVVGEVTSGMELIDQIPSTGQGDVVVMEDVTVTD